MTPRTGPRDERGFTLVEILAVIMITGFVMYAIYSVLISTLRAQDVVDETVAVYEVGPQIVDLIANDLQNVTLGVLPDEVGLEGKIESVGGYDCSVIDLVATSDSRTVLTKADKSYTSDVTEIGYACRVSEEYDGLLELFRREDWGVDDDPLEGGLYHKVYGKVREFRLEYVERGKETEEDYAEAWDSKDKKGLPHAILLRITIVVGDPTKLAEDEGVHTFERMIVLPGGEDEPESSEPQGPGR
jgi:prepilin-type N-terminal cleavage/methylation domain-containing protein